MATLGFTELVSWGILYYAFSVFVEPMESELGWTRAQITGAFSLGLMVLGAVSIPVGHWLDERGPRLLMTAGSILGVLLVVAWSRVHDLAAFYAIWIAMGLCWSATLYSPAFATVTAHFRERRLEALTVVTLIAGLASTVFYPVSAWLLASLGWRDALLVLAAILAVATVPLHALVLRAAPRSHHDQREAGLSLGEALRHPSFRWLALGFFCYALGIGVNVHLVPLLLARGVDLATAAALAGAVGAMQLVGRIALGPLERLLSPAAAVIAVYALQPIAMLLLIAGGPTAMVLVFVVLFGAGRGADTIIRNTAIARLYGARRFASIQGVLSFIITFAWAGGPVALGALYDTFGAYEQGLWIVFAASLVAVIAVSRGATMHTRRPPANSS